MVSAEQQKTASRRLDQWIENDKRTVTFREISREVGCHVNTAKNILLRYLNAHPTLSPTYILSGPLKSTASLAQTQLEPTGPSSPSATQSLAHLATQGVRIVDMDQMSDADRNSEVDVDEMGEMDEMGMRKDGGWPGNDRGASDGLGGDGGVDAERGDEEVEREEVPRWGMVLVQAEGLDEKKELFEGSSVNVHIYALGPGPVKDPAMYLVPAANVRAHKAYVKPEIYGTITGEGFKPAAAVALKDGGMEWGASSSSTKKKDEPGKKDAPGKKEEAVKADKAKAEKKDEKETKAATAKKGELKKTESKKVEVKTEPEEEKKPATKTAKNKVAEKPAPRASQKSKKRVIMSDDEDEDGESPASAAGSSKTPLGPTSSMNRADDAAAMEAMLDMDFDMSAGEEDDDEAPKAKGKKAGQAVTGSLIKVKTEPGLRKRRKVKDKVTEMDAKGYMVTKDVWREESYSGESEPEAESQTKATQSAPKKTSETTKKPESKPPASKPTPAPKPAPSGKKGGQSTLAGFFKKKA